MLDLHTFQDRTGIHFLDQSLLIRALTHPSFLNENPKQGTEDNQRLEYLGDAVLDFICSEWLYHRFPEATEGRLTRLRASLRPSVATSMSFLSLNSHSTPLMAYRLLSRAVANRHCSMPT